MVSSEAHGLLDSGLGQMMHSLADAIRGGRGRLWKSEVHRLANVNKAANTMRHVTQASVRRLIDDLHVELHLSDQLGADFVAGDEGENTTLAKTPLDGAMLRSSSSGNQWLISRCRHATLQWKAYACKRS